MLNERKQENRSIYCIYISFKKIKQILTENKSAVMPEREELEISIIKGQEKTFWNFT